MTSPADERLQSALDRLRERLPDDESIANLLEQIADHASVPNPSTAFTADQEAVLERAGMPAVEMPPLQERASTLTLHALTNIVDDTGTVARMLDVGESRIRQRVAQRTLLPVRSGARTKFPRFQFEEDHVLPGWEVVAPRFPVDAHPVAVESFLLRVSEDLEIGDQHVSPRAWLLSGGSPEAVAELVDAPDSAVK